MRSSVRQSRAKRRKGAHTFSSEIWKIAKSRLFSTQKDRTDIFPHQGIISWNFVYGVFCSVVSFEVSFAVSHFTNILHLLLSTSYITHTVSTQTIYSFILLLYTMYFVTSTSKIRISQKTPQKTLLHCSCTEFQVISLRSYVLTGSKCFGPSWEENLLKQMVQDKCVVNDPLGQTHSPTSSDHSDHYLHATFVLFCNILKSGDRRTGGNLCENNDHYRLGLWVGRVDQFVVQDIWTKWWW